MQFNMRRCNFKQRSTKIIVCISEYLSNTSIAINLVDILNSFSVSIREQLFYQVYSSICRCGRLINCLPPRCSALEAPPLLFLMNIILTEMKCLISPKQVFIALKDSLSENVTFFDIVLISQSTTLHKF